MITDPNRLHWFHSAEVPLPKGPTSFPPPRKRVHFGVVVLMDGDGIWQADWKSYNSSWSDPDTDYGRRDGGCSEAGLWWAWLELPAGCAAYSKTAGTPYARVDVETE